MTHAGGKGDCRTPCVSDCEIRREGVSYSIDTVRYLKAYYNLDSNPGLVIGDDLINGFHKWHMVNKLVE